MLITVLLGYLYLTESPLSAVQLLWINLIIDLLAALALATKLPYPSVIHEPAITDESNILNKVIWRQIYGITLWNVAVLSIFIFSGKWMFGLKYVASDQTTETFNGELTFGAEQKKLHLTLIFNVFVFLQFFNEINCRVVGARDFNVFSYIFQDYMFLCVMMIVLVIQWSACNWLSFLFDTVVLDSQLFSKCVMWGFTSLIVAFILKFIPVDLTEKVPVPIDERASIGSENVILGIYEKLD
jgi:magnesium-transporting ATPase (P-type)